MECWWRWEKCWNENHYPDECIRIIFSAGAVMGEARRERNGSIIPSGREFDTSIRSPAEYANCRLFQIFPIQLTAPNQNTINGNAVVVWVPPPSMTCIPTAHRSPSGTQRNAVRRSRSNLMKFIFIGVNLYDSPFRTNNGPEENKSHRISLIKTHLQRSDGFVSHQRCFSTNEIINTRVIWYRDWNL